MSRLKETGPAREIRKRINMLEDEIKSLRIMNGFGYTARRLTTGTTLQIKIPKLTPTVSGVEVQRFKIMEIGEIVLTCRKLQADGEEASSTSYNVYRPIKTRPGEGLPANYVDGSILAVGLQSRTFTVSVVGSQITKAFTVSQEIDPLYIVGDEIFAVSGVDGLDEDQAIWIDLNVDARKWEFTQRLVEVCVNNEIEYMMVIGSATAP